MDESIKKYDEKFFNKYIEIYRKNSLKVLKKELQKVQMDFVVSRGIGLQIKHDAIAQVIKEKTESIHAKTKHD